MPATIDTTAGVASAPAASKGVRHRSADLADHPVPRGNEEDWRFTPVRKLGPLLSGEPPTADLALDWTATGAEVATLLAGDPALGRVLVPGDRSSAVTANHSRGAIRVSVAPETTGARATVSLLGKGGTSQHQVLVEVGRHATATIVLDHRGTVTAGTNVEVDVADGAELTMVTLHDWDQDAVHLSAHAVRLGRDSRIKHTVVTLGGALVRTTVDVEYTAPGGDADLLGVFFTDGGQHQEHRLFIDHAVPHCRSNAEYRGALQGDPAGGRNGLAHSVWVGDVLIRAEAVGTSTYEMNRNLLLTDAARADSVPNLEIETGEIIGAGHASATGRFDDEQLFYLQSRGIPADEARRLVVRGFFADIVARIGVPDVGERILDSLDAELAGAPPVVAR
ncbi:MAG TPA: Fe-S cluster assembly protein SufD [Candidatus Nanopelagicales bacterium]|nr:Fe-S cluster assembly protein SufD [Candidatus Nanopelagicales bacterium]